jgi:tetratricopeptide (TPR) repeat protein
LQEAEYLYEARLFPDLEYTFKHALTHDVAYRSLLQERRRELHARIVMDIERIHAERLDEQIELLAHHALQAEVWDKALRYLRQAASKASSRWAFREAARYLELALEVIGRLPNRDEMAEQEIDVRLELRMALMPAAQNGRITGIIQDAVALGERIGDRRRLALAYAYQAYGAIELCDQPQAVESAHRSLALAEEIGEPVLTLTARHVLSQVYYTMGDFRRAIEVARPALEASEEIVIDALLKRTYAAIPFYLLHSRAEVGLFREALLDAEIMMRRADAAGHPFAIAVLGVGVGYMHVRRGVAAQAIPVLERAIKFCQTYSIEIQIPWTASCLGLAYAFTGRHEAGIEYAQEGVQRGEALGLTRFQPLRVTLLANAYLLAGRYQDARGVAHTALELARRYREQGPEAWALYLIAASAAKFEPEERNEVLDGYLAALNLADELGMRPLVAHCHLGMGQLRQRSDRNSDAKVELSRAVEMYRQMDMQFYLRQAEAELQAIH